MAPTTSESSKVLVTGAAGFLAGFLVADLLDAGHDVIGLDNLAKYGEVVRSYDRHPRYRFIEGDAKDSELMTDLANQVDHLVAAAAMVGGISYFGSRSYDLLAENERIIASTIDAAIRAHRGGTLKRVTLISSSMVYEAANVFPTPEDATERIPPPSSTYGLQKLVSERLVIAARLQYGLAYCILRLGNCVGIGERRPVAGATGGNTKLIGGHVILELVIKALRGQDPLHVLGDGGQLRQYTHGADLARGIRLSLESSAAAEETFNLATPVTTSVREIAELIWQKVHPGRALRLHHDPPFAFDVRRSEMDVSKARAILGFQAVAPIETVLDEVIPWVEREMSDGRL